MLANRFVGVNIRSIFTDKNFNDISREKKQICILRQMNDGETHVSLSAGPIMHSNVTADADVWQL